MTNLVQSFKDFLVLLYFFHQLFPLLYFCVVHHNYKRHGGLPHCLLLHYHPLQYCFLLLRQIHHPEANFLQNVLAEFAEFSENFFHSHHGKGGYATKDPLTRPPPLLILLVSLLLLQLSWQLNPIKYLMKEIYYG